MEPEPEPVAVQHRLDHDFGLGVRRPDLVHEPAESFGVKLSTGLGIFSSLGI